MKTALLTLALLLGLAAPAQAHTPHFSHVHSGWSCTIFGCDELPHYMIDWAPRTRTCTPAIIGGGCHLRSTR